jgi:hypothetical protein
MLWQYACGVEEGQHEAESRERTALKQRLEHRLALLDAHPLPSHSQLRKLSSGCVCGQRYTVAHRRQVWGEEANVDDLVLYRASRRFVVSQRMYLQHSLMDAHTEKEYKERGGTYTFAEGKKRHTLFAGTRVTCFPLY